MDFVEVPPGKYVVGVGADVRRLAIEPAVTWPDYPLATGERMIEIGRPFQISRDLVTTHQYQRAMKRPLAGAAEPVELAYFEARKVARYLGGELPAWFEWEIAVRGPEPFLYPWGNELDLAKLTLSTVKYGDWTATVVESFGDYAETVSPLGLRGLVRAGYEWNESEGGAIVRSLCDTGAMRYMVPGMRPGTEPDDHRVAHRAFSGPIAACYGVEQPDGYRRIVEQACFRVVKR